MESGTGLPTAAEASEALDAADASRAGLAARIKVPSWCIPSLGVAVAVQIATAAVGLAEDALWILVAGVVLFGVVAAVQLARFRRLNGVWLGGFAGRVVLGTGTVAQASWAAGLVVSVWAGYGGRWWLVVLGAIAGGAGWALGGRAWLRAYRADPASHGPGESTAWLALLVVVAIGLLALLLAYR